MIARRLPIFALGLALVLAVAGCNGCRGRDVPQPQASPLAFLPKQPEGVVHVPDLEKVGRTVAQLEKTRLAELAASAFGASNPEQLVRPLVQQLGFDPRQPDGFAAAGIDGKRGLAVGPDETGTQLLVVGVADAGKFDAYAASLAKRFGAATRGTARWAPPAAEGAQPRPVEVQTFAGADGAVRVAFAQRDGYAVVASEAGAVEAVGRAIVRPWESSLANDAAYRKTAGKLGARDLYVWMPKGAQLQGRRGAQFESGLALGASAGDGGVNVRVLVPRGPLELAVIQPAGKVAGGDLVPLLPAEDFLALRLGGEPQALQPLLEAVMPRGLFVRLRRAGIDPGNEILAQLRPGVVVGLGLNPEIDLSGGLPADAAVSRTNPFDFVTATVYAKVKDPARAAQVLEKLAAGAGQFQMQVASSDVDGAKVYKATYAAGEGMSWTLAGDTLIATGGKGAMEKARGRLALADAPRFEVADPSARKVFESSASAAHLVVPRLTNALRAIPESAYGVGGFRIKAIVETWVGLLDEVKGMTASFSVDDEGLVIDADLGLKK